MEADTQIKTPNTRNLVAVSDVIDSLSDLVGRFACPGKLPRDTAGLRKNGVVVLYQKPKDVARPDGTTESECHLVRFYFVTRDDIEVKANFDFRDLNARGRSYIQAWIAEVAAQVMEWREQRHTKLPPEVKTQTSSAVERAVAQVSGAKAAGRLN